MTFNYRPPRWAWPTPPKRSASYVREAEDIEAKVSSLYAKISNPVLANLKLETRRRTVRHQRNVSAANCPTLFPRHPARDLRAATTGKGHAGIKLTGQVGKETRDVSITNSSSTTKTAEGQSVRRGPCGPARKVGHLLDQIRVQGEDKNKEVVDEIIQLAKRYGITTAVHELPAGCLMLRRRLSARGPKGSQGQEGVARSLGVPQALLPGGIGGGGGKRSKEKLRPRSPISRKVWPRTTWAKSRVSNWNPIASRLKPSTAMPRTRPAAVDGINTQKSLEAAKRAFQHP